MVGLTWTVLLSATALVSCLFHRRQSIPTNLPMGWTSQGCYTGTRTLAATSYTSSNSMTVEACIAFCSLRGYKYAGVEYSSECYCDFAIQNPGAPAALGDCNFPCTGNSQETCGARNRINLFASNIPAPSVPQTIPNTRWNYKGCYVDNVSSRVLSPRLDIASGVTAESCTVACANAGYLYAGLEYGKECWCGTSIGSAIQAPEGDCHMACIANHAQFCGGPGRLTLFHNDGTTTPQICISTNIARFNPLAVYKQPSAYGPTSVSIGMINVNSVPHISYGIFSAGNGGWLFYALQGGVILPKSSVPFPAPVSLNLLSGESPTFVSTQFPPPAYSGYCSMANPSDGPPLLAGDGRSDLWSLCPNITAGGRQDVVWSARANHPHYVLANCRAIDIQLIPA